LGDELMRRLLFICSRNRLRSPTAERVFADYPGVETTSAGLAPDAEERLSADHIEDAELIFVMEQAHRTKLARRFGSLLKGKKVICLDITDSYQYMQPELVALLKARVTPHLR
jgi:predicted protein tyrosine phosphatase